MAETPGVVALTGDVGAGKSTVARILEEMGGVRFDADVVALEQWRRPEVAEAAAARWGRGVLDPSGGIINRAVAERIFSNRADYDWACALIHPLTMDALARSVAALPCGRWAVVEIPLLFEVGRPAWVKAVLFVTAPREVRLARCRERGWDEAELARRESFYLPSGERMAMSDLVLENVGDMSALRRAAESVMKKIGVGQG